MENVMLLDKLKAITGESLYNQAVSHYKSSNIVSFAYTPQGNSRYQIKAIVKANGAYGVNLILDFINERLKMDNYCTCSAAKDTVCEHAAAVIYKFITDDLPKLHPEISAPIQPEDIDFLKQIIPNPSAKIELQYEIANLDNFEDFQVIISSGDRVDFSLQLFDCLGEITYNVQKRNAMLNSLSGLDLLIFVFLEKNLSHKDLVQQAIFLPQTPENLQLILTLIQHGKAYSGSRILKSGEVLKPRLLVSGDETRVEFSYDLNEFKTLGNLNPDLQYVINKDTIYIINGSYLDKLPAQVPITPERLGVFLFEILPQLNESLTLELTPEFTAHRLTLNEPEISLFFDYQSNKVICQLEVTSLGRVYQGAECLPFLNGSIDYERSKSNPKQWYSINRNTCQELAKFFQSYRFHFATSNWVINETDYIRLMLLNGLSQLPKEWKITTSPGFQSIMHFINDTDKNESAGIWD